MYKIVRRPPCWKSTARLARHARLDLLDWLDWLDKVERVESSRVEWNLSLTYLAKTFAAYQHYPRPPVQNALRCDNAISNIADQVAT